MTSSVTFTLPPASTSPSLGLGGTQRERVSSDTNGAPVTCHSLAEELSWPPPNEAPTPREASSRPLSLPPQPTTDTKDLLGQ